MEWGKWSIEIMEWKLELLHWTQARPGNGGLGSMEPGENMKIPRVGGPLGARVLLSLPRNGANTGSCQGWWGGCQAPISWTAVKLGTKPAGPAWSLHLGGRAEKCLAEIKWRLRNSLAGLQHATVASTCPRPTLLHVSLPAHFSPGSTKPLPFKSSWTPWPSKNPR
jgi:hypothetical protein